MLAAPQTHAQELPTFPTDAGCHCTPSGLQHTDHNLHVLPIIDPFMNQVALYSANSSVQATVGSNLHAELAWVQHGRGEQPLADFIHGFPVFGEEFQPWGGLHYLLLQPMGGSHQGAVLHAPPRQ